MSKLIKQIVDTENLHWAWKKVKNNFQVGDIWYDEIELASFEANLHDNLNTLKKEILNKGFLLSMIRPLPFPKGCDSKGNPSVRQTFDISIKDQIAWMAVVNIIGPSLDSEMPWWSYGHRLYISVWKNTNDKWETGWYTHSNGQLYRKWNQSWPLFRRNVSLTAKLMCRKKTNNLDDINWGEAEKNVYENNVFLKDIFQSQYLENDYWGDRSADNLYWATIDFSKFYPKVKRKTVADNIKKHVPSADKDEDFLWLINKLMDFQIDDNDWNENELSKDGIELDPRNFEGLPTGLFVAGFLANVALLDVDKKISKYLDKNRDIAHFRFVDDHVILSYSFERLKEWIENYMQYLNDADTGAEFNYNKIEPNSLSHILNPKWYDNASDDKKREEDKAKKDTTLDPLFPAPLMTQTLAKVSAISKSDFEFLSQNEENQLVSDLEHLLLTDFPDHELKKETRVSFATSILSQIVPNSKDEYSEIYECQKRIHHILKDCQRKFKRSKPKFVEQALHSIIFDSSDDLGKYENYFNVRMAKIKDETVREKMKRVVDEILSEKKKEINLIREIRDRNQTQKKHVYQLLKKAIVESPEKVRIWSRVIDYCTKVDCCDVKDVFDKIEDLREVKKIHELSASFFQTLFMNVLADRAMKSLFSIVNERLKSKKEIEAATCFLNQIFNQGLLDSIFSSESTDKKPYYKKTYEYFRFVLGSTIFILKEYDQYGFKDYSNLISQYKLIDWLNNPQKWIKETSNPDVNAWLYWLLCKTHDKSSSSPLVFWINLEQYIDYSKPSFKPLILPFPKFCSFSGNKDLLFNIQNKEFDEGWLFELFSDNILSLSQNEKQIIKEEYPFLYNNLFSNDSSLWNFVQWQKKRLESSEGDEIDLFNRSFDPRLSEWTALEITKQIIDILSEATDFLNNSPEKPIHLANFKIQNCKLEGSEATPSWKDWSNMINDQIKIIDSVSRISDERYITKGLLDLKGKVGEQAKVHALGMVLLQLLTHETDFPWVWNSTDKSLVMESLYNKRIQEVPISSYSLLILQGCFSSRNREKFSRADELPDKCWDETKEIPPINDVATLNRYLKRAKENLESYQLSMEDNAPRQLIPISLKQLSEYNNPFDTTNN